MNMEIEVTRIVCSCGERWVAKSPTADRDLVQHRDEGHAFTMECTVIAPANYSGMVINLEYRGGGAVRQ